MNKYFYFLTILFIISCQSTNKNQFNNPSSMPDQYKEDYSIALKHLESKNYTQAIKGFQALAQYNKTNNNTKGMAYWSVLFNIGSAYEQIKQCQKALTIFSDLKSQVKDLDLEVRVLMRLHYIHECLGQPDQALNTLKDVEKKSHRLSEQSRFVEMPARFSILYAQLNDNKQSIKYQNMSFNGIQKIKSSIKDPELLNKKGAELFYLMGRSFAHPSHFQMAKYLKSLPLHQIYLIQSLLLSDTFWSPLAREELLSLYKKLAQSYKNLPFKDKPKYKSRITHALSNLQKLAVESGSDQLSKLKKQIVDNTLKRISK